MLSSSHLYLFWTMQTVAAIALSLLLTVFESRSYRRIAHLPRAELTSFDRRVVIVSILAKNLLYLLLPLAALAALAAAGHVLAASVALAGGWMAIAGWHAADVRLQRITGNHLTVYLEFALQPHCWEWGDWATTRKIVYALLAAAALGGGAAMAPYFGLALLPAEPSARPAAGMLAACVLLAVAPLALIFPLRRRMFDPSALERLHAAFPIAIEPFSPRSVTATSTVAFGTNVDQAFEELMKPIFAAMDRTTDVDRKARLTRSNPPHVLVMIVESLRYDAIVPEAMPRLSQWSQRGLLLERHFAAGNTSHLGDFSVMFGRSPLVYDAIAPTVAPPQLCCTLKNSGYRTTLVVPGASLIDDRGMNRFMGERGFDDVRYFEAGAIHERDHQCLDLVRTLLRDARQPQCIIVRPFSSHYGYYYPQPYDRRETAMVSSRGVKRSHLKADDLRNRYLNCMAFLDDEFAGLLDSLDMQRTVVAITGDHGESFGEDGFRFHSSRLSDVQTRVPMLMLGAGVPVGVERRISSHVDFLPTLLHVLNGAPMAIAGAHGCDLLDPGAPAPGALLAQPLRHAWDLLLVHPEGRLRFYLRRRPASLRVKGFADEFGRVDPTLSRDPAQVAVWLRRFEKAVAPVAAPRGS